MIENRLIRKGPEGQNLDAPSLDNARVESTDGYPELNQTESTEDSMRIEKAKELVDQKDRLMKELQRLLPDNTDIDFSQIQIPFNRIFYGTDDFESQTAMLAGLEEIVKLIREGKDMNATQIYDKAHEAIGLRMDMLGLSLDEKVIMVLAAIAVVVGLAIALASSAAIGVEIALIGVVMAMYLAVIQTTDLIIENYVSEVKIDDANVPHNGSTGNRPMLIYDAINQHLHESIHDNDFKKLLSVFERISKDGKVGDGSIGFAKVMQYYQSLVDGKKSEKINSTELAEIADLLEEKFL